MGKKSFPGKFLQPKKKKKKKKKTIEMMQRLDSSSSPNPATSSKNNGGGGSSTVVAANAKSKKKTGSRLWMRFDRTGQSELLECDRSAILQRVSIPARDLRIIGPVFSHSSSILAREKAMVVNLEFIKAIVTSEEVLLLDPLCKEVIPFVDQLKQQLPHKSPFRFQDPGLSEMHEKETRSTDGRWLRVPEAAEGLQQELPFEFQVLEIALEVVCTFLDSSVADLEVTAYPVLDELVRNVSTKNLEHVRSLKSNLTRLLARVQMVRNEIERLLDDNEDMAHLYLTRKHIQNQHSEALEAAGALNNVFNVHPNAAQLISNVRSTASLVTSEHSGYHDVEELEMLLEAFFMQLDGTRNKILSVRKYIDDTEGYVNIQLDNQRNELIHLQLILIIAYFAMNIENLMVGFMTMNLNCEIFNINGIFVPITGGMSAFCFSLFLIILGYAKKKLFG